MAQPTGRRIVMTGATGLIGAALFAALREQGDAVVVLSRDPAKAREVVPGAAAYHAWAPDGSGDWQGAVDGADAVMHLAGSPLFSFGHRQTRASVSAETARRITAIRAFVAAMERAQQRPKTFIVASSVGTYGYASFTDAMFTESSPTGTDFWGRDSVAWEEAGAGADALGIRRVILRTSYVLANDPHGGLMQQAEQFRRGFGGPVLPGKQWVPWIHIADEVGLIRFALDDARVRGPFNCTAPEVPRSREFAAMLGKVLHKPSRFAVPGFALRLGIGVAADIVVHGRKVIPQTALDLGYQFQFPTLEGALHDLLAG